MTDTEILDYLEWHLKDLCSAARSQHFDVPIGMIVMTVGHSRPNIREQLALAIERHATTRVTARLNE